MLSTFLLSSIQLYIATPAFRLAIKLGLACSCAFQRVVLTIPWALVRFCLPDKRAASDKCRHQNEWREHLPARCGMMNWHKSTDPRVPDVRIARSGRLIEHFSDLSPVIWQAAAIAMPRSEIFNTTRILALLSTSSRLKGGVTFASRFTAGVACAARDV